MSNNTKMLLPITSTDEDELEDLIDTLETLEDSHGHCPHCGRTISFLPHIHAVAS